MSLETDVRKGESLLQERGKIAAAIQSAESEMPGAIAARLDAERSLSELEAEAALGQVEEKRLASARKALAAAREKLDGISSRILGLRRKTVEMETSLSAARVALEKQIQAHTERAIDEFRREWEIASRDWGLVLSKRAALERRLNKTLDLPAPAAGTADLGGELEHPWRVLDEVAKALGQIEQNRRVEERTRRVPGVFDPETIYEFQVAHAAGGRQYQAGDRVLGAVVGQSTLEYLLKRRIVSPVAEQLAAAG